MTNQTNQATNRLAEELAPLQGRSDVEVTVVVPLYNEAATLPQLCERIGIALLGHHYEVLLIDDGSHDDSWRIILELSAASPESIRGFRHRKNRGKADALATGFANARGGAIVTIDADLQDDPAEIPALLAKLDEGYDLVSGWKQRRRDPLSKKIPSRFFNFAARAVSGIKLHDFNCGLKAYRREAVADLDLYGELHRFIPILVHAEGFRIAELPVLHFPREHGVSKYGWRRFLKGTLDLVTVTVLTRYLKRPGHFFGGIGLVTGGLGGGLLGYLSFMKLAFGENIGPRPLFFLGLLLVLFAGQMISTGIIGEFLLRLRHRSKAERVSTEFETTPGRN